MAREESVLKRFGIWVRIYFKPFRQSRLEFSVCSIDIHSTPETPIQRHQFPYPDSNGYIYYL